MSDKPENPPAFACAAENGYQGGMTLSDYFAGQIAAGMAASGTRGLNYSPFDIASRSYEIADAMLKARQS